MLKLYHYRNNIWSVKMKLVLAEKGLAYEPVTVDLFAGEQFQPWFLQLNPLHKVPVLQDNGTVVYESSIINEYLEEKYSDPPLLPKDSAGCARARLLVDFCDHHLGAHLYDLLIELVVKPKAPMLGKTDPEVVRRAREPLPEELRRLNQELSGREYLVGSYSLADVAFTPFIAALADLDMEIDRELENLRAWFTRVRSRPSFTAAEVDRRFTAVLRGEG